MPWPAEFRRQPESNGAHLLLERRRCCNARFALEMQSALTFRPSRRYRSFELGTKIWMTRVSNVIDLPAKVRLASKSDIVIRWYGRLDVKIRYMRVVNNLNNNGLVRLHLDRICARKTQTGDRVYLLANLIAFSPFRKRRDYLFDVKEQKEARFKSALHTIW